MSDSDPAARADRARAVRGVVYARNRAAAVPWGPPEPLAHALPDPVIDHQLTARLRAGDEQAFDQLFRELYPAVVRAVDRVLRDQAVAEDLAQEVFLELWRRREQLDADINLTGYALQAGRNRALNHLRHLAVQRKAAQVIPLLSESAAPPADTELVARDLESALASAMDALPPRAREVFGLSRERGLRYSEIAESLGITVKAVEANMARALRVLRERLAPYLPSDDDRP